MDPEHMPGGPSGIGEVLPPPPADIPQAGSHYPLEKVPDTHPSILGNIPPRQIIPALLILIVLFGWRPLSVFGDSFLASARTLPTRVGEEIAVIVTSVHRATSLISRQDKKLSDEVDILTEHTEAFTAHAQSALVTFGEDARDNLTSTVKTISHWVVKMWRSIASKWYLFLSGSDSNTQALADAKEELKTQLRAELLSELQASSTTGGTPRIQGQEGIVVLPKTDRAITNKLREETIKNIFSDQVMIISDESGRSGVVRPIFRSGVGEEYLYVMVPILNQ